MNGSFVCIFLYLFTILLLFNEILIKINTVILTIILKENKHKKININEGNEFFHK